PTRPNSRNSSHPSGGVRSSFSPAEAATLPSPASGGGKGGGGSATQQGDQSRQRPTSVVDELGGGEKRAAALLSWFDRHRRVLPWRAAPGEAADPYRVWLSEIMLQQTTVKAVGPYYLRFLAQFPSVTKLAEADIEDVLKLWAGLGYYARARHLHAC